MQASHRPPSPGLNRPGSAQASVSFRQEITFSDRRFNVKTLPADLHRVYKKLERDFGEDYALTFVFIFRTGMELHRAWHMTLLTSKLMHQLKDHFGIRMSWELGVIKLRFRVEDGGYQLNRKVPYDYDSEFQDIYMKIAVALMDGNINIHQALLYQDDTKAGKNSARSGLFLRDFPGRLVLYPLQAATCAVIFFGGDWFDAGVAAVTGIAAGLLEYLLTSIGGSAKTLVDVAVGTSTGAIAGLFYRYLGQRTCLPAIFLGTLYWFFYGTAFVLGILEIISGELETGVVRFMAVSVKTFVLTLGTTFGMQLTLENSLDAWQNQANTCGLINLDVEWWRIPLYLLCSASALGQYRMPISQYWRGLAVQLVGYEVQYQLFKYFAQYHEQDFLDTASANAVGAIASVVFASILSLIVDSLSYYYNARILRRVEGKFSRFGEFMFSLSVCYIRMSNCLGFGKRNDVLYLDMVEKLKKQSEELNDTAHTRSQIMLTEEEEDILFEVIVDAEDLNIWSVLMPTVYQLVPGSLIAKLWFNAVFPPPLETQERTIEGTDFVYTTVSPNQLQEAVFQNLMVIAASLALGLIIGFGLTDAGKFVLRKIFFCKAAEEAKLSESVRGGLMRKHSRQNADYTADDDDPESYREGALEVIDEEDENENEGLSKSVSEGGNSMQGDVELILSSPGSSKSRSSKSRSPDSRSPLNLFK
eukprot:CAMPEP_0204642036 /NCGR_PEP_ID=MMETSP0717-20131115/51467_1 /ASSEMBLY_ACC=CAM_ASM_000666 /TAXON_ID=230516 /ORGANISM="Chaetoceros curvisetus" /LENGTH=700 /DNA_ID=CAMNT_0051662775 /DNA_START=70 /DNA_END=2172 /DNA_ORIENTATION=+